MNMTKKIIAFLMAAIMLLGLCSCAQNNNDGTPTTTAATTTAPTNPTDQPTDPFADWNIKNLIIIIGDGMGPRHIEAGQIAYGETYDFTTWQSSTCDTDSVDATGKRVLTDSAASATAIATGTLTQNAHVGKDPNGNDLKTILDVASENGKSVGIVTSDYLYGATPAGFSAHSTNRKDYATVTTSQITSGVDFFCGRNNDEHYPAFAESIKTNYFYANDLSDKAAIMAADKAYLPVDLENGKENEISLKDASSLAIDFLSRDEDGFVLMIEQAYIDKYCHSNDMDSMIPRMKSMNDTVDLVRDWADDRKDTAIIVTADHESGGLNVSKNNTYPKTFTGVAGSFTYKWTASGSGDTDAHTRTPVGIYVYGITVDFSEINSIPNSSRKIKNIDIFVLMKNIITE